MNFRIGHGSTLVAGVVLVICALAGCERVVAERRVTWQVADPLVADASSIKDAWDRRDDRSGVIWAPAQIVADEVAYAQRAAPLPAGSLLRVEVRVLPPVNCEANPDHNRATPRALAAYPERMAPESLPALGDAGVSQELWIVPARIHRGAGFPVNYRPLALDYGETHDGPSFNLGPFWFGTPLRQAGIGRWVYFPATQDCAGYVEADAIDLPAKLFEAHHGTQGHDPSTTLTISALTPVLARVVEVCPARIEEREEHLSVLRGPQTNDLRLLVDMWRYTGKVTGMCAGGEKTFFAASRSVKDQPWSGGPFWD